MVQTKRNQRPLYKAVKPGSRVTGAEHEPADSGDRRLDRRPDKVHEDPHENVKQGAHDRDKPRSAEKREHLGKLDLIIPVVEPCRPKPHEDPAEHSHLQGPDPRDHGAGALFQGIRSAVYFDHRSDRSMHDEERDDRR